MKWAEIAASNVEAIQSMHAGENVRAVGLLLDAVKEAFTLSRLPGERLATFPSPVYSSILSHDLISIAMSPLPNATFLKTPIYDCAFMVPKADESTLSTVSALLLFNAALAVHRSGLYTGKAESLQSALLMYKEAHAFIEGINLMKTPWLVSLVAAIYYNLSQVFGELYMIQESRFFSKKLARIFQWSGSLLMREEDFTFFHVNLYLAGIEDFRLAPAA